MADAFGQAVAAAMKAGNVVTTPGGAQGGPPAAPASYAELSATSQAEQLRHAALLKRVDAERRARRIVVPTGDLDVRRLLRKLGHPVRLFGETPADARDRLREILARIEIDGEERDLVAALLAEADQKNGGTSSGDAQAATPSPSAALSSFSSAAHAAARPSTTKGDVYAPASDALYEARRAQARFSFAAARSRLREHKRRRDDADASLAHERATARCYSALRSLGLSQTQVADARPVCRVRALAAPSAPPAVATASWSGSVKVWSAETCALLATLDVGDDRVTGVAWSPKRAASHNTFMLAVGAADGAATLWAVGGSDDDAAAAAAPVPEDDEDQEGTRKTTTTTTTSPGGGWLAEKLLTCKGHKDRLGNVAFEPSGRSFATTSYDHTWRLWDVETGTELLLQDGHDRETYAISFQPDGALVATGDFAGVVHAWDLRSGKLAWTALGHGGKVLAAAFSPDGYRLATGADDHTVRAWDLRRKCCDYVLPAHSALVSDVAWAPDTGEALATAAFDGTVALWSTRDWTALGTPIKAHDGKAMSLDFVSVAAGGSSSSSSSSRDLALVTCGWDRTFKIWTADGLAAF